MQKLTLSLAVAAALAATTSGCVHNAEQDTMDKAALKVADAKDAESMKVDAANPFFVQWDTPFGMPPFEQIKNEHYRPAFDYAIKQARNEIELVANNPEAPSFNNTIEALEYNGKDLTKVANVFFNLTSANTNKELQAISREIGPKLSALRDDVNLNPKLFARVKAVYEQRNELGLRPDQMKLLEDRYKGFVRGGAELNDAEKSKLRELNKQLTELSIKFGDNVLAENNNWEMVIDDKADLAGLPQNIIDAAAETAKKRGHEGKWVFTTHRPSKNPFLIYSTNRELREKIYQAYTHRGDNDNANDNKKIAAKIAALRSQKAQLLGYQNHADFVLENRVAKNAENVTKLLDQIWPAAIKQAKKEVAAMQKMIDEEGGDFKFRASDWRHYSEKIRKAKYDLDEEATKPYFSLEDTLNGVFYIANKLYGMNFKERFDLPKYHEDVRTFEVNDANGDLIGIYITDHYVRGGKRGGAWMNSYRKQFVDENGKFQKPIIVNVLNYPRPVGDEPTLLTFDQASTLFHEFGHAAHGFLSDGVYPSQTGTSVPRDFVEFPSQVHENWMMEPEVLAQFAKHYKTGEVIPQQMIEKIQAASKFNQGFATTEYMAATLLDLAWHTIEDGQERDADEFEAKVLDEYGLIDEIAPRYRTTYFSHIFSGGYSAGYYSYIWSDIFGADAYQAFRENGIFDEKTAKAFVDNVLSKGGTEDPLKLYKQFRGKEADPQYLLKSRGLIN
ncbi:M3 family metallopeptidase [Kangiella sp. TOML190]|uniref:M3 family metallopeptidase n=1 Tax=Kangiella sp. TOML190 TaxID=2931351 RepID=UPI00204133F9|nr:M3 family metallopeptidase [Kangiella sp. TOML190]